MGEPADVEEGARPVDEGGDADSRGDARLAQRQGLDMATAG
jgi:hypothetical protein